jgi:hypothetical protein
MRAYVRRWINEWNLHRIHGDFALHTQEEEPSVDYGEDVDLETPTEGTETEEA